MKTKTQARINRIIGQLEGLKKALAQDEYDCEQVIFQLKAVIGSTKALGKAITTEEMQRCINQGLSTEESLDKLKVLVDAAF